MRCPNCGADSMEFHASLSRITFGEALLVSHCTKCLTTISWGKGVIVDAKTLNPIPGPEDRA